MSEDSVAGFLDRSSELYPERKGNLLDPHPDGMSGKLPCGYVDEEGVVHADYTVRELTGVEEDLLAARGDKHENLTQMVANCVRSIGPITDRASVSRIVRGLSAPDREMLLVSIRRASIGDDFDFDARCPACGRTHKMSIDLGMLDVRHMPDPARRVYENRLSRGAVVEWHVLTYEDERWLQSARDKLKGQADITLAMLARIDKINGEKLDRDGPRLSKAVAAVRALSLVDRSELRRLFLEVEGGLDTKIEIVCPNMDCRHEYERAIPFGPSFFYPQET